MLAMDLQKCLLCCMRVMVVLKLWKQQQAPEEAASLGGGSKLGKAASCMGSKVLKVVTMLLLS